MMEGTFRVSRNTRAQWFLQFLNKTVVWNPEVECVLNPDESLYNVSSKAKSLEIILSTLLVA